MAGGFDSGNIPGMTVAVTSSESNVYFGGRDGQTTLTDFPMRIGSTAVDAGNSGLTTTLRGGLVMVQPTANAKCLPYKMTGITGNVVGVLHKHLNMLNSVGVAEDKFSYVFSRGQLYAIEIPNLDYAVAAQLVARGFVFDNPIYNRAYGVMNDVTVTGNVTATVADHGTRWICNAASVVITLPEITTAGPIDAPATLGLEFEAYQYTASAVTFATAASGTRPCFAGVTGISDTAVVTAAQGQRIRVVCRSLPVGYRYVAELLSGAS